MGWQSGDIPTPLQINISTFLLSEEKNRTDEESRIEFNACMQEDNSFHFKIILVYCELEDEIPKLSADDWMYAKTEYHN
jgi:hypothetical protein